MNKPTKVILLDDADEEYKKLNEVVGKQSNEGKENTPEMQLVTSSSALKNSPNQIGSA